MSLSLSEVMRRATIADDRQHPHEFRAWATTLRLFGIRPVRTGNGYLIGWSRGVERWTAYGDRRES